jgi:hypothetical protein
MDLIWYNVCIISNADILVKSHWRYKLMCVVMHLNFFEWQFVLNLAETRVKAKLAAQLMSLSCCLVLEHSLSNNMTAMD